MITKKFQLKNGLKVILVESHKSPVVSIQMWVRTGSADEKKGEEGISHFIEHLVFKGTRKFKVGEIASIIEGSGGELNAYTSFDQTVFYVTISKEFQETGLEAIAEMMGFPLFDKTEIDNEREVVIEEIKRGQDSLGRMASQLLFSTAFKSHPYGIPVIGFDKNIREFSVNKIKNYYHARYSPKNMFLVVAGDFKSSEMKKLVEQNYSDLKTYKIRKSNRKKEKAQKNYIVAVQESSFEQSIGYISWKVPSLKHKDIPALDLLAMILGAGDSSRLTQKLRIQSATVNSIGSSVFSPQDEGLFVISFGYNKENLQLALTKISECIQDLFLIPPTAEEVMRAIISLEADKFYSEETVDGIARSVGSQEFAAKDLKFQEKYLKAIQKLTVEDLLKVAKKYLVPAKTIVTIVTNDNNEKVTQTAHNWCLQLKKDLSQIKAVKIKTKKAKKQKIQSKLGSKTAPIEKIVLDNGVTVLFRESDETHLVSAKAAFLGGLRNEHETEAGITDLLTRSWMGGTTGRSETQILNQIESIAASMSPIAGRNSIGLGIDMLSSFEESGRDIFLDVLTQPIFDKEVVEREKTIQLQDIKQKYDNPANVAGREFMSLIFKDHPYSRELLGTEETVKALTQEKIIKHWTLLTQRKNLTIAVTGSLDKKAWIKEIEARCNVFGPGEKMNTEYPVSKISEPIKKHIESKKEQSHVFYGFRGLKIADSDRYALQVMQSVLAGQGGRLFIELRDKNSLAYSVSPIHMEGIECGYFGAYIGCSPEKVNKAISMMNEQFKLLIDKPISKDELVRAQRYLVGRHDIDLQRTSAVTSTILYEDIYGIDYNESFQAAKKYFEVTQDQVQSLAQKILSQNPVIAVVGAGNPFA